MVATLKCNLTSLPPSPFHVQNNISFTNFSFQAKEEEVNAIKQDSIRLTRQREAIQRKLRTVEVEKIETEHQKETLKNQISALEKGREMSSIRFTKF